MSRTEGGSQGQARDESSQGRNQKVVSEKKQHLLTQQEMRGTIFSEQEKQRMRKSFAIPDLDTIRGGNLVEKEKAMRWKSAEQLVNVLEEGFTVKEASHMLNIDVSPLHFGMALLESRGLKIEDPYLIAAMFGIDQASLIADSSSYEGQSAELMEKYACKKETISDFRRRIQTDLHSHVEHVAKLHAEVFSYTHATLEISSKGGQPEQRLVGTHVVQDQHSTTWENYQDCSVSEHSEYFTCKPWPRQEERQAQLIQDLANRLEFLRKTRDGHAKDLESAIAKVLAPTSNSLRSLYACRRLSGTLRHER